MSDRDQKDQSGKNGRSEGKPAPPSDPARHLFGHVSGSTSRLAGSAGPSPQPGSRSAHIGSAPYPVDAQYAPRPLTEKFEPVSDAPESSSIFSDVDDEAKLTKLHPNYKLLMRIGAVVIGFIVVIVGLIVDGAMQAEEVPVPFGIVSGIAALLAVFIIIRIPLARYNARGYQISRDRLRVVRGIMWRSDTIVPFGRIQHIDVDQGPIERALDIATMTLHTAGSHNASVSLPGLGHELAVQMREEIREYIKRESM